MNTLTDSEVLKIYSYDPDSGSLYKNGEITGTIAGHGYLYTTSGIGNRWSVHRLAWFLHYKSWPTGVIDHINRNKLDNRISNLRDVSQTINLLNHGKPFSGIYKNRSKWRVRVGRKGEAGTYHCFGQALKARNDKLKEVINES